MQEKRIRLWRGPEPSWRFCTMGWGETLILTSLMQFLERLN